MFQSVFLLDELSDEPAFAVIGQSINQARTIRDATEAIEEAMGYDRLWFVTKFLSSIDSFIVSGENTEEAMLRKALQDQFPITHLTRYVHSILVMARVGIGRELEPEEFLSQRFARILCLYRLCQKLLLLRITGMGIAARAALKAGNTERHLGLEERIRGCYAAALRGSRSQQWAHDMLLNMSVDYLLPQLPRELQDEI